MGEISMKYTYFNNAADANPLAPGVIEAVTKAMQEQPQVSSGNAPATPDNLYQCRTRLAQLLGVNTAQTVLTSGTTCGLNAALLGLELKPGDLVIASVMEHYSVLRSLAMLEEQCGVRVEYVPLNAYAKLDMKAYAKLLSEKPRLVVLAHASNVTGRINPVRSWFDWAKFVGAYTLLDASQTAGRIPVIADELLADMVVFPGYKGLRGPLGTGGLYIGHEITQKPVSAEGKGAQRDKRTQPEELPIRLEPGTPNSPAYAGLRAALCYYAEHASEIFAKEVMIMERLLTGLLRIPNIRVFDKDPLDRLPVISFSINGVDADTAGLALADDYGIECRTGPRSAPLMHKALGTKGMIKLSMSYRNNIDCIDYMLDAVKAVARAS